MCKENKSIFHEIHVGKYTLAKLLLTLLNNGFETLNSTRSFKTSEINFMSTALLKLTLYRECQ